MNTALAEEGRRPSDTYDNNDTALSVIYTLLKEYYHVAMSFCRYTMSVVARVTMCGHFMLVFSGVHSACSVR